VWSSFLAQTITVVITSSGITMEDMGDEGSQNQCDHMTAVVAGGQLMSHTYLPSHELA